MEFRAEDSWKTRPTEREQLIGASGLGSETFLAAADQGQGAAGAQPSELAAAAPETCSLATFDED